MISARAGMAALAAMAALAGAIPAQGATTVGSEAVTVTYLDGSSPGDWSLTVVAQTPQTTSISLDTLNLDVQYWPAIDTTGEGTVNGGAHSSVLELLVHPGYRLTGLSFHALAYGELVPGQLADGQAGSADNRATLAWSFTSAGSTLPFSRTFSNFQGLQPVALDSGPLALQGSLRLDLSAVVWAQAMAATGDGGYAESRALASIGNALLNVQVAAIPEPATYAMLLAGLGLLGGLARRRGGR